MMVETIFIIFIQNHVQFALLSVILFQIGDNEILKHVSIKSLYLIDFWSRCRICMIESHQFHDCKMMTKFLMRFKTFEFF